MTYHFVPKLPLLEELLLGIDTGLNSRRKSLFPVTMMFYFEWRRRNCCPNCLDISNLYSGNTDFLAGLVRESGQKPPRSLHFARFASDGSTTFELHFLFFVVLRST